MATVVNISLGDVILNPRSHRIRAQLESADRRHAVTDDPYGDEAQELIADLLRKTDQFDDLKANLDDKGQAEPGVVSHTGLLVNANTRCVALRDLGQKFIRVAVLPENASEHEIDRLELQLQMKRDFRTDYTFTNELLFIDDLVKKHGYKPREIAIEMNWASSPEGAGLKRAEELVEQRQRMLTIIREVQLMSGYRLPLTSFDSARQAILELDEDYERLKRKNEAWARQLRDTRLVGLLSGAGYRELREIDEKFLEDYLVPSMEDQDLFRGRVDKVMQAESQVDAADIPGLEVLEPLTDAVGSGERSASNLLALLTESAGKQQVVIRGGGLEPLELSRSLFVEELKQAIESAAEDARVDRAQGDLLDRPRLFIRKASRALKAAIDAFQKVNNKPQFNRAAFRTVVKELGESQQALEKMIDGE